MRLVAGDAADTTDYYQLKKDFDRVKTELDILKNTGFESMRKWMSEQMSGLGPQNFNASAGGSLDQGQLNSLMNDNKKLQNMIQNLIEQGLAGQSVHQMTVQGQDPNAAFALPGQSPQPDRPMHGEILGGTLPKFSNTQLKVYG